MTSSARSFTRFAMLTMLLVVMRAGASPVVAASADEPVSGIWMAASGAEPGVGTNWGRLILRDGVLTFQSPSMGWKLSIAEIKRVTISEQSDRLFVLESVAGETYYVAILGQNLVSESPRKAMQVINRALRAPVARRE